MKRKRKQQYPEPFRSEFEYEVSKKLQPLGFTYESTKIPYEVPRVYTPDFVLDQGERILYIECKGYFRAGDTQKYKAIAASLSWTEELIFILMKPEQKVSKHAKLTMGQWCDKENIHWYCLDTMEDFINNELKL